MNQRRRQIARHIHSEAKLLEFRHFPDAVKRYRVMRKIFWWVGLYDERQYSGRVNGNVIALSPLKSSKLPWVTSLAYPYCDLPVLFSPLSQIQLLVIPSKGSVPVSGPHIL